MEATGKSTFLFPHTPTKTIHKTMAFFLNFNMFSALSNFGMSSDFLFFYGASFRDKWCIFAIGSGSNRFTPALSTVDSPPPLLRLFFVFQCPVNVASAIEPPFIGGRTFFLFIQCFDPPLTVFQMPAYPVYGPAIYHRSS